MKNKITIISDGDSFELNTYEDILTLLLGNEYLEKSDITKQKIINNKVALNFNNYDINISEFEYILYLINYDKIVVIENINSNIFRKYLNSDNDEVIIVNNYIKEILENYKKV